MAPVLLALRIQGFQEYPYQYTGAGAGPEAAEWV